MLSNILNCIGDITPKIILLIILVLYHKRKLDHKLTCGLLIFVTLFIVLNALYRLGVIPPWKELFFSAS